MQDENRLTHIVVIHSDKYKLPILPLLEEIGIVVIYRLWKKERNQEWGVNTLYITDIGFVCKELRGQGLPVVALLQEYNQTENFSATPYAVEQLEDITYQYWNNIWKRFQKLPWMIAETNRCMIREMMLEDSNEIKKLYEQEEVRKFLKQDQTEELSEPAYIHSYIEKVYGFYQFGIWMIIEKQTGAIMGQAGFEMKEDTIEPQLGYVLHPIYQGKGYAYEVCKKILEIAKVEYEIEEVVAVVAKENIRSRSLCEKLGFADCIINNKEGKVIYKYK